MDIFRGVTEGGCTSISCGNMVRAENGLKEIGLDLSAEYEEIEKTLTINPYQERDGALLHNKCMIKQNNLDIHQSQRQKLLT